MRRLVDRWLVKCYDSQVLCLVDVRKKRGSIVQREYPATPIVAVGLVILDGERVVFVRRDKEPLKGWWTFPGGAIELGEEVREAARREAQEETGLDVEVVGIAAVVDHIDRDEAGRVCYHYVIVDFEAYPVGGSLQPGTDVSDARWVSLAELDELRVTEKAEEIARDYLDRAQGRCRPGAPER